MGKQSIGPFYTLFNAAFYVFVLIAAIIVVKELVEWGDDEEIVNLSIRSELLEAPVPQKVMLASKDPLLPEYELVTSAWGIKFATPDLWIRISRTMILFFRIGFALIVLFIMRSFLRSLLASETFTVQNINRLQRIGCLILLIEPFQWASNYFTKQLLFQYFKMDTVDKSLAFRLGETVGYALGSGDFVFNWIFAGLLVLTIAEVFKHGLKLKEEADLTV
jgi:hypothetical protein